jgi:hypothetical protein
MRVGSSRSPELAELLRMWRRRGMKHADRLSARNLLPRIFLIAVLAAVFGSRMPVNYFSVREGESTLLASPMPSGASFVTTYIHSLELTPVVDDYRFVCGKIWGWEEWTRSHNAGLPSVAPEHSRIITRPPWMIVRGGRFGTDSINYRVGTAAFGRNTWRLAPFDELPAYERYPARRVSFETSIKTLSEAVAIGFAEE